MPIRINLLAEAQALEESRRKDPVKRAIWVGSGVGIVMLAWAASLQFNALMSKHALHRIEADIRNYTNEFQTVQENDRKLDDANLKLAQLTRLATNRLLNASILNALQRTTVDEVQLIRLKTEHVYVPTEEVKSKTNSAGRIITKAKPPTITEKITLTLDAKDSSANPGSDQVYKYQATLAEEPYFQKVLGKTNVVRLTSIAPQQPATADMKAFVQFSLECRFPEKTR